MSRESPVLLFCHLFVLFLVHFHFHPVVICPIVWFSGYLFYWRYGRGYRVPSVYFKMISFFFFPSPLPETSIETNYHTSGLCCALELLLLWWWENQGSAYPPRCTILSKTDEEKKRNKRRSKEEFFSFKLLQFTWVLALLQTFFPEKHQQSDLYSHHTA